MQRNFVNTAISLHCSAPKTLHITQLKERLTYHVLGQRRIDEKKSRIRETKNLSTDADSRTDTILERLHDLLKKNKKK